MMAKKRIAPPPVVKRSLKAIRTRVEPIGELVVDKLQEGWKRYKDYIQKNEQFRLDRQYLPAVVELQESPPSPTARIMLWGTLGFITVALLWGIFGQVDIVAVGHGKTVPTGRVKVVQPLEAGVVKSIHVQDGQYVKAGEALIDLDVTLTGADQTKLRQELRLTEADIARLQGLLDGTQPLLPVALNSSEQRTAEALFSEAKAQHESEIAVLKQQLKQKRNELQGTQAQVKRLRASVPLITSRAESYARLAAKNYVARNQATSAEEQRLQAVADLATSQARSGELEAEIAGTQEQLEATVANFKHNTLSELNDKTQKRVELVQELAKADERNRLQRLVAPIAGTVQELKVHTVGGVVTPAQELLKVVPQEDALEAEVMIQNKDVGFVQEGQAVRIKLDAFPFTRYGLIEGTVRRLSLDAVNDEKLGLVYTARVALKQATLPVNGKEVVLGSGLSVSAEIKTGSRSVISYFLSPVMQYSDESMRER